MRGKDLFEKFTNIKEEYIQEVETETDRIANANTNANTNAKPKVNKVVAYRKWAALVACIIGVLVIYPFASDLLIGMNESLSMDSAITTEGVPETSGSALEESAEEDSAVEDSAVEDSAVEDSAVEDSAVEDSALDESVAGGEVADSKILEEATTESLGAGSSSQFLDMYVDISTFPIYDADVEMELMLDDRMVILETFLDNELESLVYDLFINSEASEYLCTTTIHSMSVLTEEEVESFADSFALDLDAYVADENLEQTAIVLVDLTWEETYGEIGGGTYEYIPEGRYKKYFILGQAEGSDMFEVWGVYLGER